MKWVIFVNNMFLPPIAPSRQKGKNMIKVTKITAIKNIKGTEPTLLNPMIFMLERNMLNKDQVKVNVLTVENLNILIKIVIKNLVS